MYEALVIAKYVINKSTSESSPISNLKLQKLLYFLWKEYYEKTKKHLFKEKICAWQFGPVVPNVYYNYCVYGGIPIQKKYDNINIDKCDSDILDRILEKYTKFTASQLVSKTHSEGTPWEKIYSTNGDKSVIPFDLIEQS